MTLLRSFRARLLLASLLWTSGLLGLTHLVSMLAMHHLPRLLRTPPHVLVLVSVVLMAFGLAQVAATLGELRRLRAQLGAVRAGDAPRVEGRFPSEVQPLVADLNELLEHRERVVRRALAKAGDLAHGLKTPLAVLTHEADRAAAAGHAELAASLGHEIERMRRQIEYHLAHARAAASGAAPGTRCDVLPSAEALARTLMRLHDGRGVAIELRVSAAHAVRAGREDLEEMLGNLLDNACKWARSRVVLATAVKGDLVSVTVDDDGAGIPPEMRERVLQRGVRADEAAPGSGLGLAIVRDLAELYGGSVGLEDSPLSGLRVCLRLPAA